MHSQLGVSVLVWLTFVILQNGVALMLLGKIITSSVIPDDIII
jgi:hypothetical protein